MPKAPVATGFHAILNLTTRLLILVIVFLLPTQHAKADVGPKPSVDFKFNYECIQKNPIIEGELLLCEDESCTKYEALDTRWFKCQTNSCASNYFPVYGTTHFKLVVTYEDKVRHSNVFTKQAFAAQYYVQVRENALVVEEIPYTIYGNLFYIGAYAVALVATMVSETIIAGIYFQLSGMDSKLIRLVALANFISLSTLWLVIVPLLFPSQSALIWGAFSLLLWPVILVIAEILIIAFEAFFLFDNAREQGVTWREALGLSILTNVGSILVWWFLTFIVAF